MDISYDPAKDRRNVLVRGLSFELVHLFDWNSASVAEDTRRTYGERRFLATGTIGSRVHVVVFTLRAARLHVISLRKANAREIHRYEAEINKAQAESGAGR